MLPFPSYDPHGGYNKRDIGRYNDELTRVAVTGSGKTNVIPPPLYSAPQSEHWSNRTTSLEVKPNENQLLFL